MHPITLAFTDPSVEKAYCLERFMQTHRAVVVVSVVNIALHIIGIVAAADLLFILGPGCSFYVLLLLLRVYARRIARLQSHEAAHTFFTRGVVVAGMLVTVELTVVQHIGVSLSTAQMIGSTSLYIPAFACFRLLAMPPLARLFLVAFVGASWFIAPAISPLGSWVEWVVICCHLLVAEVGVGYAFECWVRRRFLERQQQAAAAASLSGGRPEPSVGALASLPSSSPVENPLQPLSLHFVDAALEDEYRLRRFRGSFSLACLAGWLALFFGATLLSRWHVAALLLVLLVARVGLHALHDQRAAHRLHAQMLGLCYAAIPALLVASEYRGEGSLRMATGEPLNLGLVSCILVLMSLYARQTGMGEAARLGLEAAVAACAFVGPRLTAVGHPLEALCAAATLLVGELLGYSVERQLRLTHFDGLQTRRKLAAAEAHAAEMEREAARLRSELTAVLSEGSDGAALSPRQLEGLVGADEVRRSLQLSDFSLERRAGAGSFATVYKASTCTPSSSSKYSLSEGTAPLRASLSTASFLELLGGGLREEELHVALAALVPILRPGGDPVQEVLAHLVSRRASGEPLPTALAQVERLLWPYAQAGGSVRSKGSGDGSGGGDGGSGGGDGGGGGGESGGGSGDSRGSRSSLSSLGGFSGSEEGERPRLPPSLVQVPRTVTPPPVPPLVQIPRTAVPPEGAFLRPACAMSRSGSCSCSCSGGSGSGGGGGGQGRLCRLDPPEPSPVDLSSLPSVPPNRLRWLLEPLFQDGVDKGLPNLLRKLESSGRSGGADLQRCTRALVDVATSTGAVTLASAARAFSACPDAASAQLLWHEFGRTVQALQAHGILSRQMPPVSRGILLGDLPGQTR